MSLEGGDLAPPRSSRRAGGGRMLLELAEVKLWDSPPRGPIGDSGVELSSGRLDREDVERLIDELDLWLEVRWGIDPIERKRA